MELPKQLPIFFTEKEVLLPGAISPFRTTNKLQVTSVEHILNAHGSIGRSLFAGVVPQRSSENDQKKIGTIAIVASVSSSSWSSSKWSLILLGFQRVKILEIDPDKPFLAASYELVDDKIDTDNEETSKILEQFQKASEKFSDIAFGLHPVFSRMKGLSMPSSIEGFMADTLASVFLSSYEDKLDYLYTLDVVERIKKITPLCNKDMLKKFEGFRPMKLNRIRPVVGLDDEGDELSELHEKIKKAKLPEYANKVALKELQRLRRTGAFSAEYGVIRNYVELITELPWSLSAKEEALDIRKAKEHLDLDHYGMEKVKKRVVEYLAVKQLRNNLRGPILCFVGPPGVGKTSIGRSIATTLGRPFHRISLGGISTQSEIRGHRKTYVGAMPGRIVQALKTVGVNNPVLLLDEIDKLGSGGTHGDPGAALLEVLDPEQNCHFFDHYLGIPFDLSQVVFIATANSVQRIPQPLYDRMEVIPVSPYTLEEKVAIALKHLLPKQLDHHGLTPDSLEVTEEIVKTIVLRYTREAGVRSLERKLAAICRAIAVKTAERQLEKDSHFLDHSLLEEILGVPTYDIEELWGCIGTPGIAIGLAIDVSIGQGSITVIEASKIAAGSGRLELTGKLGQVMKESAQVAFNWLRSIAYRYDLAKFGSDLMNEIDVHINFPAGAVSKDGSSAGIAIGVALVSLFTGIPVSPDVALTGEISLRGDVLPVGGIKEKVLSAYRAGLRRVIIPRKCERDLIDIPTKVLAEMSIVTVTHMEEVVEAAFDGELMPARRPSALSSKL